MRVDGMPAPPSPNSVGEWQDRYDYREPPLELSGSAAAWNFREDDSDYYTQPGRLFRLMSKAQQKVLCENTAGAMGDAPEFIRIRNIGKNPAPSARILPMPGFSHPWTVS
jgi:catalase